MSMQVVLIKMKQFMHRRAACGSDNLMFALFEELVRNFPKIENKVLNRGSLVLP